MHFPITPTSPHPKQHLTSSVMLQDIVVGLPDGLTVPDMERREAKELLAEMGRSPTTREMAMRELTADPEQWVKFMVKYELGLEEPDAR